MADVTKDPDIASADGKYEKGLAVRREVLGDDYVEAVLNSDSPFVQSFQELVTENCWGTVWTRDGIDRKTRCLLTVGLLTALNRPHELKLHLEGALRSGCTLQEIEEVLLHASVYAGIPAGVDAHRVAHQLVAERPALSEDGAAATTEKGET